MLEKLRERLQVNTPKRLELAMPEAAVLIPVVTHPEPTLLFTLRAAHLSTHSGQVAFPGGKREANDTDLLATALRESEEEIALPPSQVDVIGQLSDVVSLHGIKVTPYVGIVPPNLSLRPDPGEIASIFEVPLKHFLADQREYTDVIPVNGRRYYVPSYRQDEHVIWGLSAMMLVELLAEGFNMQINLFERPLGTLRHHPERGLPPR
ncbi:CoA pyrophosphatase [Halomonas halocynthiae]|uniref:CoA pyrophosphatase n=1 Tax=Halomonas halocynthiae TaxID=176290 RepID=UPI000400E2D5|nr:CoA pyrophosphatase [Halomonas halocynthiae]